MNYGNLIVTPPTPEELQRRIEQLLREVFPHLRDENFKAVAGTSRGILGVKLDATYALTFTIGSAATAASIVKDSTPPTPTLQSMGVQVMPLRRSIQRMGLRNEVWTDFQGWVFNAKTIYDTCLRPRMTFRVMLKWRPDVLTHSEGEVFYPGEKIEAVCFDDTVMIYSGWKPELPPEGAASIFDDPPEPEQPKDRPPLRWQTTVSKQVVLGAIEAGILHGKWLSPSPPPEDEV